MVPSPNSIILASGRNFTYPSVRKAVCWIRDLQGSVLFGRLDPMWYLRVSRGFRILNLHNIVDF